MPSSHPILANLRACVRPLLVDSGVPAAPVGIWGSCLLANYQGLPFVVTAAHLVRSNHSGEVRILASDRAMKRLPLSQGIGVFADRPEEEVDALVYPATLADLSRRDVKNSRLVRLEDSGATQWERSAPVAQFVVVGYPRVLSLVDYDAGKVIANQVLLLGTYVSPVDGVAHMHTLRVDNPLELSEFAGFSGGAVFLIHQRLAADPICQFCGMAVQGTVTSGLVHFLDLHCLLHLVNEAKAHTRRFGTRLPERIKKFKG